MYNTYTSSAVLTLRTKGHLLFSPFNDHSNLLTERFDKNPLSSSQCCSCCNCCSCCCASSFSTHRLPLNPSLFYGLRQSTLIQLSPCKRLIFGGRDRYYYRVLDYDLDHEVCCSFKEKGSGERIERRRKGRFGGKDLRQRRCLSSVDDVEAVISLLSEEVSEECSGDRGQSGTFSKRVEMEKRNNFNSSERPQSRKKNVRLGSLESESKSQFELVTGEFKKDGYRRKAEREEDQRKEEREEYRKEEERKEREEKVERKTVLRGEDRRGRKASSSFSSYYSLSSTGDFESDKEVQDEHVGLLGESSSGYKEELWGGENKSGGQVVGKVSEKRISTTRTGADWDLRKKTEKKLTEVEEMQLINDSSQLCSRIARTSESEDWKVSSSDKQIGDKNGKSTLAVDFEKGTKKKNNQTDNQVSEQIQFRQNYQEITDIQEIQGRNGKTTSQYQRQFNGREGNLKVNADLIGERRVGYRKTADESIGKGNLTSNALQLSEISEAGNTNAGRLSKLQRQSESRSKIQEEERSRMSVWETSEKHQQTLEQVSGQIESTGSSQQMSEISKIRDDKSSTFILQSEAGMKDREKSISEFHLVGQAKEQRFHTDQEALQRIQSGKGSQDITNISVNVTNVSVIHASDKERVYDSKISSEKRVIDRGSELTSVVKPIQETRERCNQTAERITEAKSRNEAHRTSEVPSFQEKPSEQPSSSQASLNMVSQARIQQIDVEDGNYRSSQAMMMPPSHQVVNRGSLHVNPISETATQDVSGRTSDSSSSAFYENSAGRTPTSFQEPYGRDGKDEYHGEPLKLLTPEDAMGSAYRLEESSMQFVGEFMEKSRQEVSSSETRREKDFKQKLVEGKKEKRKNSSQFGSESLQLKEQDSKRLSGGSGEKGPSDEMWDVTDLSLQEPPEAEAHKGSTSNKDAVVRRTGRSLWSIIADVVRLRWGSRAETPKSGRRSGGKSSSNDSVSSEAWFSGRDPEENSDKNVERERSVTKETSSSHHLQLGRTTSQGQGEVSSTSVSKSKITRLEVDTSPPSTTLKFGSTSKGISSPSEEENLVWGEDGKSFEGTQGHDQKSSHVFPPSTVGKSSSPLLPSSGMSTFIVEESYGGGKADMSISGSMELMEQPVSTKSTEVSGAEGMEGELKQRRLQRNKQVPKDKFDEWEEAYVRENEQRKIDEMFMREALLEAKKAADTWEVPVGAVLVQHGKIIARGYNLVEELRDSTAHAEMICIREASNQLRSWRLAETTLYVTLEPCPMCAGAILQARIDTVVWGAPNKLLGADGSWIRLFPNGGGGSGSELVDKPPAPVHPFHPNMKIRRGILAPECADVMQQFFQLRRRKKAKSGDSPHNKPSLPIASHQSKILHKMHDIFHALLCL
eukprot:XP_015572016.1 tRNA(adenine(34)) deaminase, chloroplastic [Ricinus communis]